MSTGITRDEAREILATMTAEAVVGWRATVREELAEALGEVDTLRREVQELRRTLDSRTEHLV